MIIGRTMGRRISLIVIGGLLATSLGCGREAPSRPTEPTRTVSRADAGTPPPETASTGSPRDAGTPAAPLATCAELMPAQLPPAQTFSVDDIAQTYTTDAEGDVAVATYPSYGDLTVFDSSGTPTKHSMMTDPIGLADGFVATHWVTHFDVGPSPEWVRISMSGDQETLSYNPYSAIAAPAPEQGLAMGSRDGVTRIDGTGTPLWTTPALSEDPVFAYGLGAVATSGHLFATSNGKGSVTGRWFEASGAPLTSTFALPAELTDDVSIEPFTLEPLAQGAVLIRGERTSRLIEADSTIPSDVPAWLSDRLVSQAFRPAADVRLIREGRGYAFLPKPHLSADCTSQIEIVTTDGQSCGAVRIGTPGAPCVTRPFSIGLDGSLLQADQSHPSQVNVWRNIFALPPGSSAGEPMKPEIGETVRPFVDAPASLSGTCSQPSGSSCADIVPDLIGLPSALLTPDLKGGCVATPFVDGAGNWLMVESSDSTTDTYEGELYSSQLADLGPTSPFFWSNGLVPLTSGFLGASVDGVFSIGTPSPAQAPMRTYSLVGVPGVAGAVALASNRVTRFDDSGHASWTSTIFPDHALTNIWAFALSTGGWTLLVVDGEYNVGMDALAGRWLDPTGAWATDWFSVGPRSWMAEGYYEEGLLPLLDGGFAIFVGGRWRGEIKPGATSLSPLPCWLDGDVSTKFGQNIHPLPSRKGYWAMSLANDTPGLQRLTLFNAAGDICGGIELRTTPGPAQALSIGGDGSLIQQPFGIDRVPSTCETFVWKQLFR